MTNSLSSNKFQKMFHEENKTTQSTQLKNNHIHLFELYRPEMYKKSRKLPNPNRND